MCPGPSVELHFRFVCYRTLKYGALSTPSGRLTVSWTITGDAAFALTWTEAGGPAVQPPSRRGFGTTLIEEALTGELDAEVSREFLPSGLRCTIGLPLTEEIGRARAAGAVKRVVP